MAKPINYDLEITVSKGRRLAKEVVNLLFVSLGALLLFATATYPITKSTNAYQALLKEEETSMTTLQTIGSESGLAKKKSDGTYLDTYDMFERYAYKQIHLSFELYKSDFESALFHSISDPYNQPTLTKDNDELQRFYTVYAPSKGLVSKDNPEKWYFTEVLNLDKHKNIFVKLESKDTIILNPEFDNDGTKQNFGVLLYREFYDGDKGAARKAVHDFYKEYYEQALSMLEGYPEYYEANKAYENAYANKSMANGWGMLLSFLVAYLLINLLPAIFSKQSTCLADLAFRSKAYDENGNETKTAKRIGYCLAKLLPSVFALAIPFYISYGLSPLTAPLLRLGSVYMPFAAVIIFSLALWLINTLMVFARSKENQTLLDTIFKIRYIEGRIIVEKGY